MSDYNPLNAIERLFALYEQQMYRIAFAVVKDEGQAEDAVMTAFERVVRRQGVPCDPDSAHAQRLMASMARQCAIDIYRKNARERERFVQVAADAAGLAAGATSAAADGPESQALAAASVASRKGDVSRSAIAAEEGIDTSADEMLAALPTPNREAQSPYWRQMPRKPPNYPRQTRQMRLRKQRLASAMCPLAAPSMLTRSAALTAFCIAMSTWCFLMAFPRAQAWQW